MSAEPVNIEHANASLPRQQAATAASAARLGWIELLVLRPRNQPIAAVILLCFTLGLGGWYLWRATTVPGLVELDRSEPTTSKLVVNINTAEAAELMLLPEIGKTTSYKIIEERETNGDFRNPLEFGARIKGIGPKTLPKVTPFLEGWTDEPKK